MKMNISVNIEQTGEQEWTVKVSSDPSLHYETKVNNDIAAAKFVGSSVYDIIAEKAWR